jgi:hypothetical protein
MPWRARRAWRRAVDPLSPPADLLWHGDEALGRWLAAAAGHLGLEDEPTPIPYGEVERLLQRAGPAHRSQLKGRPK